MTTSSTPAGVSAVVVLAAGGGTRMKSAKPKVLHEVAGHSMIGHALRAATALEPEHLVVVVGHQRDQVLSHLTEIAPHVSTAVQEEQRGTGHAVECGLAGQGEMSGEIVVTYGDVPMLTGETLNLMVQSHRDSGNHITVLTADVPEPTGYGRIVRDGDVVRAIVEHKDATEEQLMITEINSGIFVFNASSLYHGLSNLNDDNAQGELYLTDVVEIASARGERVGAYQIDDLWQTEGVNDRVQLSAINAEMNRRIVNYWMREGVTVVDPASTWIHDSVDLARDVTLLPGVSLEGATSVGEAATIGPDTTLVDVEVGPAASVTRSHASLAVIGASATVGPYSYLRPGTTLGTKSKGGAFVEMKNATVADGAKVPHLSYVGDAVIEEGANIGAGTIFANYDGQNKSLTHVGENAFIGSNSVLVAPVDVSDGAFVAAGSTITNNVPAGGLAVARGRQRNIEGWISRTRPGTKWDVSAKTSDGEVDQAVAEQRAARTATPSEAVAEPTPGSDTK